MIPLIGYTDRLSMRPGESLEVKVSSVGPAPYKAELVRVISGDPNPAGPGIRIEPVASDFEGAYPSRPQTVALGSHMRAEAGGPLPPAIHLRAVVWPTTPDKGRQGVLCQGAEVGGVALAIGPTGAEVSCGAVRLATGRRLRPRTWYRLTAVIDTVAGRLSVWQEPLGDAGRWDEAASAEAGLSANAMPATDHPFLVAALSEDDTAGHFNGKIEAPAIYDGTSGTNDIEAAAPLAAWHFGRDMQSLEVPATGPLGCTGTLVGAPARAMTGSRWDASEMCWRHAPEQYAAIHFHDDDIADCGWETDFRFTPPADLASGVYAVRLTCGDHWDMLPVFVCPPKGTTTAKLCVVVPTFTYVIYANQARAEFGQGWRDRAAAWGAFPYNPAEHPDFGLSTYNNHTDGSGICHATWHRPILNLRPGYHVFAEDYSGSGLRHFPADTHLFAWLEEKGIPFDVVTDWELHHEGVELLRPYAAVTTTTHPEYHTTASLDAIKDYRDGGGRLIYLGGNGFYWRIALHAEEDGLIEIRRAEGGLRAWASEAGEYYHAFDGTYGGTWRCNARPPQQLVGVGYSAQGAFEGTYYRRRPESRRPEVAWIFDGVDGDVIGDFGLNGGGAAGYELDRTDSRLGTPETAVVLATSENPPAHFVMPPDEWLTHVKTRPGPPPEELIRADMVYFDCPGGGAVFSVGSITFCGALPVNGFDNDISRILENVVLRFTGAG